MSDMGALAAASGINVTTKDRRAGPEQRRGPAESDGGGVLTVAEEIHRGRLAVVSPADDERDDVRDEQTPDEHRELVGEAGQE
jgi:hypothetical protein